MKETFAVWDASDYIETPEDEKLHLEVYAEEDPGDGSMIRAALRDIAQAQNITRLANEAGLTRRSVYKALSAEGNPSMATLLKIAKALGLRLRLERADEEVVGGGQGGA